MRLVFMGTPDFAVAALEALVDAGHEVGMVITQPDRKGSRGKVKFSPVKEAALSMGLRVLQPENVNSDEVVSEIREYGPDACVVVAYGQIIKKMLLGIPKYGMLNIHASLLPRFRGASPMQAAILAGEKETGVTIMRIDEGLDSGDMLLKGSTPVDSKNFETLHDELSAMGAELICEALSKLSDGTAEFVPQNEEEASYAGMITKKDGKIDFRESAGAIERKFRAFDPWPGAYFDMDGLQVKLRAANVSDREGGSPGEIIDISKDGMTVSTGRGSLIIKEIQLPGKNKVTIRDYLLGHKLETGTLLK